MENSSNFWKKSFRCSLLYQYLAVITGILITVCSGMQGGWPSPSLPLLLQQNSTIPTTNADGSWIAAAFFMGQPIGSFIASLLVNRIGRKTCLLMTSVIMVTSWLITAYATNVFTIECSRILAGVGGGMMLVALLMYIVEVSDKTIRGLLGCSIKVAAKLGLLLINLIGTQLDIRTTAFISVSIPVLHFATFIWMPESPYFFILRNQKQKAAKSLQKLTRTSNVEAKLFELNSIIVSPTNQEKVCVIFTKDANRKALAVSLGLISIEHLSGFYVITSYGFMILNQSGGAIKGSTAIVIYYVVQLVSTIISCLLVDRIGRKPLLIVSTIGSGCALLMEGIYFYQYQTTLDKTIWSFVPLAALLMFTFSYCIGLATVPLLIAAELIPTSIKAYAIILIDIWISILGTVVTKVFQITKDQYGMYVPFFIFALFCIIGVLFIRYFVPETKGKSLEEIQLEWNKVNIKTNKQNSEQTSFLDSKIGKF